MVFRAIKTVDQYYKQKIAFCFLLSQNTIKEHFILIFRFTYVESSVPIHWLCGVNQCLTVLPSNICIW